MRRTRFTVIGTSLVLGLVGCGRNILLGDAPTSGGGDGGTHDAGLSRPIELGTFAVDAGIVLGSCSFPFDARNTWLLFDSDAVPNNRDLYAMRTDGSAIVRLTTDPSNEQNPTVSPNGRYLAFVSDRTGWNEIYVEDLATGALAQLTTARDGAEQPSWSSDSSQIVFHSGVSVWIMTADGSGQRSVAPGADDHVNTAEYPSLSPDGTQVVFDLVNDIDAVRPDGTGQRSIGQGGMFDETPAVSPDGSLVAHAVQCGSGPEQIAITSLGGEDLGYACAPRRITSTEGWARRPAWGPSRVVAFELRESGPGGAMRMIPPLPLPPASIAAIAPDAPNTSAWCVLVGGSGDNRNPSWAPAGYEPR